MQSARNQFFASAAFAANEHCGIGRRDFGDIFVEHGHLRMCADHVITRIEFAAQHRGFRREALVVLDVLNRRADLIGDGGQELLIGGRKETRTRAAIEINQAAHAVGRHNRRGEHGAYIAVTKSLALAQLLIGGHIVVEH